MAYGAALREDRRAIDRLAQSGIRDNNESDCQNSGTDHGIAPSLLQE
jgi:hypothetical protein